MNKPKSQFETTADYERRKAGLLTTQILPGISLSDRLAFVLSDPGNDVASLLTGTRVKYDADTQMLTVTTSFEEKAFILENGQPKLATMELNGKLDSRGHYVGQNAFGATADVTRLFSENYGIAVDEGSWIASRLSSMLFMTVASLRVEPERARELFAHVRVLLICTLKSPWIHSTIEHSGPTIDSPSDYFQTDKYIHVNPEEFWVYDDRSGAVLTKINEESIRNEQIRIRRAHEQLYPLRLEIDDARRNLVSTRESANEFRIGSTVYDQIICC